MARVIAESDLPPGAEPLLLRLQANLQIIFRNREGLAIQSPRRGGNTAQDTDATNIKQLHDFLDAPCRLCRTTSYSTTPAATDTFNEGTSPSIGIDTRKSQCLLTSSWTPLPSAPSTTAQCIL